MFNYYTPKCEPDTKVFQKLKIGNQVAITLRDYQQSLIRLVYEKWDKGLLKILLQLPTGAGKSIILSEIARNFYQRQEPILVLAHTQELIFQLRDALESACGVLVGVVKSGVKANPERLIQVAAHNRYQQSWVGIKFLESKPSLVSLKVCAKKLRYKPSWAKYKFKEISANLPIEGEFV